LACSDFKARYYADYSDWYQGELMAKKIVVVFPTSTEAKFFQRADV
jgi:hypothetical protein